MPIARSASAASKNPHIRPAWIFIKKTGSHQQLGLTSGGAHHAQDSLPVRGRSSTVDRMRKSLLRACISVLALPAGEGITVTDSVRLPPDKEQDVMPLGDEAVKMLTRRKRPRSH